jgi:hypothetical protein
MEQDVTIVHRAIACAGKAAGVSGGQGWTRCGHASHYQPNAKGTN